MPKVSLGLAANSSAVLESSEDFGRWTVIALQPCPGSTDIGATVLDAKSWDGTPRS